MPTLLASVCFWIGVGIAFVAIVGPYIFTDGNRAPEEETLGHHDQAQGERRGGGGTPLP